jgi:hypothetical protein
METLMTVQQSQSQLPADSAPEPTPVPQDMQALAREAANTSVSSEPPQAATKAPDSSHAGGDAQEFACHIHEYLRENIEFTDKKATFVFAINAALLIYMYQQQMQLRWMKAPATWLASDLFVLVSMLALFVGAVLCALVVAPRFTKTHRGYVFFGSISEFESASDFSASVFHQTKLQITEALLKHNFDLAKVCTGKFKLLSIGLWTSFIGATLAISVLLLNKPVASATSNTSSTGASQAASTTGSTNAVR